jgi:putative DNA primase/helicase
LIGLENADVRHWYPLAGIANVQIDNIPAELRGLRQWVAWTGSDKGPGKKPGKVPINPLTGGNASSTAPSTWGSFDEAVARARRDGLLGVGLMFADDDLVGVDLDDVIDNGKFTNPLAETLVRKLDTYCELSPSGRGLKMWLRSDVHPPSCSGTYRRDGGALDFETYHKGRFFVMTGRILPQYGSGLVQTRSEALGEMVAEPNPTSVDEPATPTIAQPALPAEVVAEEEGMLRAALKHVNPDAEGTWFRIGCCLKSWGAGAGDAVARGLWDEWSRRSEKFDPATQDERWERMESDRGLTVGTLFKEAMAAGYEYGDAIGSDGARYRVEARPSCLEDIDRRPVGAENSLDQPLRPTVELHTVGGWSRVTAIDAADNLGKACADCGEIFGRNGAVVYVRRGATVPVEPHDLAVVAARNAKLLIRKEPKGQNGQKERLVPTTATPGQCQDILAAREFVDKLPPLRLISKCPVLVDDGNGGLRAVTGYDRSSGVFAMGGTAEDVPLDEAKALILGVLEDFDFATPGDKSRAIAALITPALVMGGLLAGRAPIDLGEADDSQAGKGYRQKIVEAVYNDSSAKVVQKTGGTGSMEETYSAALIAGACFITFDNVKGRLDSPMIESSLTEDFCDARMPYGKPMQVDMRRVCVSMTSNAAQLSRDLSKRCSPVRIRRRPDGYAFKAYSEGDLLAHVRANQGCYLGAVLSVVKVWASAGRPMEPDSGQHDFRVWARTMDWIVRRIFGGASICDGVRSTQARMSNPNLGWLRDVAILVARERLLDQPMKAHQIAKLLDDCGAEVPGVDKGADLADDANFRGANQAVGRKLSAAFGRDLPEVEIDGTRISRTKLLGADGKASYVYLFSAIRTGPEDPVGGPTNGVGAFDGRSGGRLGGNQGVGGAADSVVALQVCGSDRLPPNGEHLPPDPSPNAPPDKSLVPPIPPNESNFFLPLWNFGQFSHPDYSYALSVRKNTDHQADQAEKTMKRKDDTHNLVGNLEHTTI